MVGIVSLILLDSRVLAHKQTAIRLQRLDWPTFEPFAIVVLCQILQEQLGVAAAQHGFGDLRPIAMPHLAQSLKRQHHRRAELAALR